MSARERLANGELEPGRLTLEDYNWEIKGGGNPAIDLTDIEWNDDGIGKVVRFPDLQSYLVVHLAALRDVETDLRNSRISLLLKLIEACGIDQAERKALCDILNEANTKIDASPTVSSDASPTVSSIAQSIDAALKNVSGPAFEMDGEASAAQLLTEDRVTFGGG